MKIKKNTVKRIIFISACFVLLIAAACIILTLYSGHVRERRARILTLIETYYGQSDYAAAQALALNILLDDPEDKDAAAWLEKIRDARLAGDRERDVGTPAAAVPGENDALLQSLLAELKKIKTKLADLEKKNGGQRITYIQQDNARTAGTDKAVDRPEQDITELMRSGLAAFENKDYGKAKYYFSQALKLRETDPDANALLAASIYRENPQDGENLEKAIAYCKTALRVDNRNKLAYITLGDIYQAGGSREPALANYLEALNIDPRDASLYYRVGVLHYELGENEKAEINFNKALALREDLPQPYLYLGRIQKKRGALEQAISSFKRAVYYDKGFYSAFVELGDCYVELREYASALDMYNQALELKQSLEVRVKKGDCLLAMGLSAQAKNEYRAAVVTNPLRTIRDRNAAAALFYGRALAAFQQGNDRDAIMLAETGISTGGKQADFYLLLGRIARKNKDYAQAEEYCAKSLKMDEYNTDAYLELALAYAGQGEKDQAVSTLQLLREKVPAFVGTEAFKATQRIINEM